MIPNNLGSERSVEIPFLEGFLEQNPNKLILDVGGIPTDRRLMERSYQIIKDNQIDYRVADFRGGQYQGDFVSYDFGDDLFDVILFISSLEHFPCCTEGDRVYRPNEDINGYRKALNILKPSGRIVLTVPYGKNEWFGFHQSYDWDHLLRLTEGSTIEEEWIYKLVDNNWYLVDPDAVTEISNPGPVNSVGCFILKKDG